MPRKGRKVRVVWKWTMFNKRGYTITTVLYDKNSQEIDREGDYLIEVPTNLSQFPKLHKLNLSCNMIGTTIDRLCDLTNLTYLDLSMCGVKHLPPEFANLQKLEHLDLDYNYNLKHICKSLALLKSLKELKLSKTNLNISEKGKTHKPPKLERLGSLVELELLDLSWNSFIDKIPSELKNCTKLKTICLYENSVTCINSAYELFTREQIDLFNPHPF